MPSATTSMLICGPKLLMGAKAVSSPKGFRNGACGGCARVAVDASSAHRKTNEADHANNQRARDVMPGSLFRPAESLHPSEATTQVNWKLCEERAAKT